MSRSGPSSPASPRYVEPFPVFLMHLLSRLSNRGSVTRRCWRSWPHTRWKLLPPCLPWRTSAPGPLRAVHGTRPLKIHPGATTRATSARVSRMATAGHALPARHQAGLGGAQLQQILARSIPHSCEEARSGRKPTLVAPSPLRRKARSGHTKPTLVALSDDKPIPVAPPTLHLCKSYP